MVSEESEPNSLALLNSTEQANLLNAIEKLRGKGVNKHNISFPQLVVCGDQSSGKSSVLEGLTRLRFPTKDTLCTTFATELILRRTPHGHVNIQCTITPGDNRTERQKQHLRDFERTYTAREEFEFPTLIEEAKDCMRFGTTAASGAPPTCFFKDVLRIKYSAPDIPSLTIVDLPGIVHSQTEGKTADEVNTVKNLVKGYMRDEKSIILAVVCASNNFENQIVLTYAAEPDIDPGHLRTLGIITKPDLLDGGSESEKNFVDLVKNQKLQLKLGWHVVKNRGFKTRDQSDAERDESERKFFSSGIWSSIESNHIGIDSLRKRLANVLLSQIRQELPSLIDEVNAAQNEIESSINALGEPRDTKDKMRSFLVLKAEGFRELTGCALNGIYSDPFFHDPSRNHAVKLRTRVTNLHFTFAEVMHRRGHTWNIDARTGLDQLFPAQHSIFDDEEPDHADYASCPEPETVTRHEFLQTHVAKQLHQNRISAYPLPNERVISAVFRKQSQKWNNIARIHLALVEKAVMEYLDECLNSLMDSRTADSLYQGLIEPALQKKRLIIQQKLEDVLVANGSQDPIMYEPGFQMEYQNLRASRSTQKKFGHDSVTNEDILDLMQCYYKRAISIFINNVVVLVLENCLVASLSSIFSASLITEMNEYELRAIAQEPAEVHEDRKSLKTKLDDMIEAKRILRVQARTGRNGVSRSARNAKTERKLQVRQFPKPPHTPEFRSAKDYDSDATLCVKPNSPERSKSPSGRLTVPPASATKSRRHSLEPEIATPSRTSQIQVSVSPSPSSFASLTIPKEQSWQQKPVLTTYRTVAHPVAQEPDEEL
ncbi:P-loop containing nucleoside triphosphate hydrolase protein [Delitschia confertaspora ATCC 74209]|uniref:P-loop containing nucleoside triphosphate hydrolase protein n=1 Tax=Delitschia confertaspora ATCC 74209 TaxID=1513339 RepID=A0A9P4JST1_9PLEO|nr:P-loop containing nucleoside triphosphate hydrolase protein [Delitschia confertaspora ATCC 74209]